MNKRFVLGKIKFWKGLAMEKWGKFTGDEELRKEGESQRVRGKIQTSVEESPKEFSNKWADA